MGLKCTLRDTCLSIDNEGDAHWSKDQSAANIGSSTRAFQALHVRKYHCPLAMLPQPCPQESLDRGAGPQSKIQLHSAIVLRIVFGCFWNRNVSLPDQSECFVLLHSNHWSVWIFPTTDVASSQLLEWLNLVD